MNKLENLDLTLDNAIILDNALDNAIILDKEETWSKSIFLCLKQL